MRIAWPWVINEGPDQVHIQSKSFAKKLSSYRLYKYIIYLH